MSNICHTQKREKWGHTEYVPVHSESLKRLYMVEGWENSAPDKCYKTCTKI